MTDMQVLGKVVIVAMCLIFVYVTLQNNKWNKFLLNFLKHI